MAARAIGRDFDWLATGISGHNERAIFSPEVL